MPLSYFYFLRALYPCVIIPPDVFFEISAVLRIIRIHSLHRKDPDIVVISSCQIIEHQDRFPWRQPYVHEPVMRLHDTIKGPPAIRYGRPSMFGVHSSIRSS